MRRAAQAIDALAGEGPDFAVLLFTVQSRRRRPRRQACKRLAMPRCNAFSEVSSGKRFQQESEFREEILKKN